MARTVISLTDTKIKKAKAQEKEYSLSFINPKIKNKAREMRLSKIA